MIDVKEYIGILKEKGRLSMIEMQEWDDYDNRRLNLADVEEDTVGGVVYSIQHYNHLDKDIPIRDRKPIILNINSNGGLLIDSMFLVDVIKRSKTPIYGICEARAYSAGGLILVGCHKRYCYPSSTFLLHCGSNGFIGDSAKMIDSVEFDKRYFEKVKKHYLDNTDISEELYMEKYRHEWYFTGEDMIKYGIVDEILEEILF